MPRLTLFQPAPAGGAAPDYYFGRSLNAAKGATLRCGEITIPSPSDTVLQPPAGETWLLKYMGLDVPMKCSYHIGATVYDILTGTDFSNQLSNGQFVIDNTHYLEFHNVSGATHYVHYRAVLLPSTVVMVGAMNEILAKATWDIIPTAAQTWLITAFIGKYSDVYLRLSNALRTSVNMHSLAQTTIMNTPYPFMYIDLSIDATYYASLYNDNAATSAKVGYMGVRIS